jgi:hypothetical protein
LIGEKIVNKCVYVISGDFSGEKRVSLLPRQAIVSIASLKAFSEGTSLEEFADIPYIKDAEGNFHPTRELEGEELFDVAVDYLNDLNYLFLVFDTDARGTRRFLERAAGYGIEESARLLLKYA